MKNKGNYIDFKKKLYRFTINLIIFIENLPKDNVSRRLGDQLLRSGTSVIANYVEAKSASSRKDFINYFTISLKQRNKTVAGIIERYKKGLGIRYGHSFK